MAFSEVRCSRCSHIGFACAGALPKMLRCSACRYVEFFRTGKQTIRAAYVEDDVDVAAAWRRYENGNGQLDHSHDAPLREPQAAPQPQPQQRRPRKPRKPRRAYSARGKRVLVPRVVEAV